MKRNLPPYVYPKGRKGYLYFIRDGVTQRMPDDPASAEFAALYARLRNGGQITPAKRSFAKLIAHYIEHGKYKTLSPNTRKSYRQAMEYFRDKIGHLDPADLRRAHIIQMRDALADKPTTAARRIAVLSVLYEHAINIDWVQVNPAKGVTLPKGKRAPRKPWPAALIEAFRAEADPDTLLLFEMLLGTGQRISDVLKMRWNQIEDGGIYIAQGKTGTKLFIPFTDHLLNILAQTPRRGLFIVSQPDGRPVSYQLAWKWVRGVRGKIGAMDYDIHALRHTTASELAALDLDNEHIMAITGHRSADMVTLYAGEAAQKARAKKAQSERNKKGRGNHEA